MGRRRRRSLLTRTLPAPRLARSAPKSEATPAEEPSEGPLAAGEASSADGPVSEEPGGVDDAALTDGIAALGDPSSDGSNAFVKSPGQEQLEADPTAATPPAASGPVDVGRQGTPILAGPRPSEVETVDRGTEPITSNADTAADANGDAKSEVRFVGQREMLRGWQPRRRFRTRPLVTTAELQLASSIAALAVVMILVGVFGMLALYAIVAG